MAKFKKSAVNMSLLASIASGAVTHVSQSDGLPLVNNDPPLIEVNTNIIDDEGNAAVRLTDAGKALLPNGNVAKTDLVKADTPVYAIITNAVLPTKIRRGRGGGGAPTLYPWATMEVGTSFFVPVSEKHPNPVKSLTSAVSSANMKYSEPVMGEDGQPETKTVTRTKRGPGNKAEKDVTGNKVKETVQRPVMKPTRKFELSEVKNGVDYGGWKAPSDGVLVARVM